MTAMDLCVIGGGLAGTAVCAAFGGETSTILLIERDTVASGASGNFRGLIVPYLTNNETPVSALYRDAYSEIQLELKRLSTKGLLNSLETPGALQLPSAHRPKKLIAHLQQYPDSAPGTQVLTAPEAAEKTGLPLITSALYYEGASIVSPAELSRSWLLESKAAVLQHTAALSIHRAHDTWKVLDGNGSLLCTAKQLVIANAYDCVQFEETSYLKVEAVRGQVLTMPTPPELKNLSMALCYDGYLLPSREGKILLGAGYDHDNFDSTISHEVNIDMVQRFEKWTSIKLPVEQIEGRVSFRTSTHDRMPYVGLLPDFKEISRMNLLWSRIQDVTLPTLPDLYVSTGHGSRGLLSAFIAARIIRDAATRHPSPSEHAALLDPMRLARKMIRQEEFVKVPT